MHFSNFPDFVAIGTLVGIFFSLLRRNSQTRLRYLFVGWVLILVHFISIVAPSGSGFAAEVTGFIEVATLLLASVAFIWAGRAWDGDPTQKSRRMLLAAAPSLAYLAYDQSAATPHVVFYALSALGLAFTLGAAELGRPRRYRILDTTAIVAFYASEVILAAFVSPDSSVSWLLACAYFAAAISFWRNAEKISTGTIATTCAFVAWGCVFPIADLLGRFAPALQVDSEVWNLPKFLVATGMILALLEGQLARNEQLALEDDLTGLPNRRLYEDRFAQSLSQARRNGHRVALFSIDVDHFKDVNDTFGHVAGDEVLRLLASRFTLALRDTDTLARTGGDEFGAIVDSVPDRSTAQAIADALHESIAMPIVVADHALTTTVSVGVALYPDDGLDATTLKAYADREMYRDKRRTRAH